MYNDIVFKKNFDQSETMRVNLDSNVVPEDNMQHWLDDPHFVSSCSFVVC